MGVSGALFRLECLDTELGAGFYSLLRSFTGLAGLDTGQGPLSKPAEPGLAGEALKLGQNGSRLFGFALRRASPAPLDRTGPFGWLG